MTARSTRSWRHALPVAFAALVLTAAGVLAVLPHPGSVGAAVGPDALQQDPVEVCGAVVTDTVWSASVGRYRATCSVRVPEDVGLTIEPGVEVTFLDNASLQVNGRLTIAGASAADVVFTSDKPEKARGDWPGVVIDRGAAASISGLTVRYAGRGSNPAVQVRGAEGVTLDQLLIEDTDAEGFRVDSVGVTIRKSLFRMVGQTRRASPGAAAGFAWSAGPLAAPRRPLRTVDRGVVRVWRFGGELGVREDSLDDWRSDEQRPLRGCLHG